MSAAEHDLAIVTAERDGAREAYDKMKAERDAALDALHRVRRALGLGGVLGRPETIAESAERRAEREEASAAWQALCVRAAGWVGEGPEAGRYPSDDEARAFRAALIDGRISSRSVIGLAFFARLMAIVSRPS